MRINYFKGKSARRSRGPACMNHYNAGMLRGVLFDLGSTLIHTSHDHNWAVTLNRMRADLLAQLQVEGYGLDPSAFHAAFAERVRAFDEQRQTDWVEYTAAYILGA